jgi:hypothetical protein
MMISTFGAPAGNRLTSLLGEYTDCAMVGPALLPDAFGGKGSASCALTIPGAASIRQEMLVARSSVFFVHDIAVARLVDLAFIFVLSRSDLSFARFGSTRGRWSSWI